MISSNLLNHPLGDVLPSPQEDTMTQTETLSSQWLARCSQDSLSSILGKRPGDSIQVQCSVQDTTAEIGQTHSGDARARSLPSCKANTLNTELT